MPQQNGFAVDVMTQDISKASFVERDLYTLSFMLCILSFIFNVLCFMLCALFEQMS